MAKRRRLQFLASSGLAICGLFGPSVLHAQTLQSYEELRAQISDMYDEILLRGPSIHRPPEVLDILSPLRSAPAQRAGAPAGGVTAMPPAQIEIVDLRIVLVQLAFTAGSNDQLSVVLAQGSAAPKAIIVQNGASDLAGLRDWIANQPNAGDLMTGDTLNVPLMVMQTGRLNLGAGDVVHLSTEGGAFIANLGVMVMEGADIIATATPNPKVADYRPFVVTAGVGQAILSNSLFEGLGFGGTAVFSGVSVINRGLYAPIGPSTLVDNVLRETRNATFEGGAGQLVASNVFIGERSGGLVMRNTRDAEIASNLFVGKRPGAVLRITDASLDSKVLKNVILNSTGTGIAVTQGSHGTVIADNLVWQSGGGGISVSQSDCVRMENNVAIDSARKGIELRTSRQSQLTSNVTMGNGSSGIFIGDQPVGTRTPVRSNVFVGNRYGLSSASADHLSLHDNNFRDQFPRFLEGDLASQAPKIVANLRGTEDIELLAGGITVFNIAPVTCQSQVED